MLGKLLNLGRVGLVLFSVLLMSFGQLLPAQSSDYRLKADRVVSMNPRMAAHGSAATSEGTQYRRCPNTLCLRLAVPSAVPDRAPNAVAYETLPETIPASRAPGVPMPPPRPS